MYDYTYTPENLQLERWIQVQVVCFRGVYYLSSLVLEPGVQLPDIPSGTLT